MSKEDTNPYFREKVHRSDDTQVTVERRASTTGRVTIKTSNPDMMPRCFRSAAENSNKTFGPSHDKRRRLNAEWREIKEENPELAARAWDLAVEEYAKIKETEQQRMMEAVAKRRD